ncbi:MAG: cysteine desulfurase family protein [Thermodesulfobacteriota bacterium]
MDKLIYLDNNSTTKIDPRVLDTIVPYLTEHYANASSTHSFGIEAHKAVENARAQIAELISCETNEIIFTYGATEAINLTIKGIAENYKDKGNHIVSVCTEHNAVLHTCKYLENVGYNITYLPVQSDGLIDLDDLKRAITSNTILVSVMYANNEIGVIQPIKEISYIAHQAGAFFMTDATQGFGKIPIDVDELGIDLMTFSGHKIHAPKGIGGLFVRSRQPDKVKLQPIIHGGGHERNLRSGTLNVPGIVGLGKACEIAKAEMNEESKYLVKLRDKLETELLKIEGTKVNGSTEHRMPNVTNILFDGVDSDALIMGLNGIIVSNGSACTSASIEPSHVLLSLGLNEQEAFSSIRFSLGRFNTEDEIDTVILSVKEKVVYLKMKIAL